MNKNRRYSIDRNILFRQCLNGTREILQDTIFHSRVHQINSNTVSKRMILEEDAHIHYFSYTHKKNLFQDNPVSYVRHKNSHDILKNLKKGKYDPDIFLDLHGLTQYQARKALGQLILTCQKEKIFCAHIMHGYGKNILKKQTPFWLSQHPDIIAFHQAPKTFGNDAALIVIIDIHVHIKKDKRFHLV